MYGDLPHNAFPIQNVWGAPPYKMYGDTHHKGHSRVIYWTWFNMTQTYAPSFRPPHARRVHNGGTSDALLDPKKTSSCSNYLVRFFFFHPDTLTSGTQKGAHFWRPSRQRNGAKTTQKLSHLNIEIVSGTLLRPDQAFERPQRPAESPATPISRPGCRGKCAFHVQHFERNK